MTKAEITSLIEEHKAFLMSYAMKRSNYHKENAEELFQDTALKLLINYSKYDSAQGKFTTYAGRIMTNLAIDKFRSSKTKAHSHSNLVQINDFQINEEKTLDLNHLMGTSLNEGEYLFDQEFIMKVISELPKRCKEVIIWRMQGYDYQTIADQLNIKVNTLKPNLNRARKLIWEKIEEELDYQHKLVA